MSFEFSADDWPDVDLGDYNEALRNGYSSEAAYVYAVESETSRKRFTAPPEHGHTNDDVASGQPMEFEYFNTSGHHAYDFSVHDSRESPLNDGGAYSTFLVDPSIMSHAYPEPPSPSAAFGPGSAWMMPNQDFFAADISMHEASASTLVAIETPPTPSMVYTSSSPPSNQSQPGPAPHNMQLDARIHGQPPENHHWADTYAGRRGAKAREDFPRECGVCHKRFLYEDSAIKHYRLHHNGPPNIIQRYDAPKRPAPGRPRNNKAAKSRTRRGGTPSIAASDDQSGPPRTAAGHPSPRVHHPVLTYFAGQEPIQISVAGADAVSGNSLASIQDPAMSSHPNSTYVGHYPAQSTILSHGIDSAGEIATINQPDANTLILSNVDPAILAMSSDQGPLHSRQYISPNTLNLSQSSDVRSPSSANRPIASFTNQRPLPPLATTSAPTTAQEVLPNNRQLAATTVPDQAQEAIDWNNFGSQQVNSQHAVHTDSLSLRSAQSETDASPTPTLIITPNTSPATTPATTLSTLQSQVDVTGQHTQPRMPPFGSYNEQEERIVLHPLEQRWYKRIEGVWKHWDNEVSAWVIGP